MKKYFSKKLFLSIIVVLAILFMHKNVYAVGGQASGTSGSKEENVSYYFELIRAMETPTGTLGKSSNINTETYVDSSGNGIDCHLQKNTEHGTITLLSASEYGISSSQSTGLGTTGVCGINGDPEFVANTYSSEKDGDLVTTDYNGALTRADSRYVNRYYGSKYSITGDGIGETDSWENSSSSGFVSVSSPVFLRYYWGSMTNNGDYYHTVLRIR